MIQFGYRKTESYNQCDVFDMPDECTVEMKQPKETFTLLTPVNQVKEMQLSAVIDPSNFSSKQRLLQVIAQVLKCALFWKYKLMNKAISDSLSPLVIMSAEHHEVEKTLDWRDTSHSD